MLDRHTRYGSEENLRPQSLGTLFTTAWTRQALDAIVEKGLIHLTEVQPYLLTPRQISYPLQGQKLWESQKDWELEVLEASLSERQVIWAISLLQSLTPTRPVLVEHVQNLFHRRLKQTHSSTFSSAYSIWG